MPRIIGGTGYGTWSRCAAIPTGRPRYRPHPGGFAYASDLVRGLKRAARRSRFRSPPIRKVIRNPAGVAADVENLKRKIDAGASRAITQFFFDTDVFLALPRSLRGRRHSRRHRAGHSADHPLSRNCCALQSAAGPSIPDWLRRRFDGLDEDPETRRMIAAHVAIEQVQQLRRHGVEEFHFYTLNRAELTYAICHALGLRPRALETARPLCAGRPVHRLVEARMSRANPA